MASHSMRAPRVHCLTATLPLCWPSAAFVLWSLPDRTSISANRSLDCSNYRVRSSCSICTAIGRSSGWIFIEQFLSGLNFQRTTVGTNLHRTESLTDWISIEMAVHFMVHSVHLQIFKPYLFHFFFPNCSPSNLANWVCVQTALFGWLFVRIDLRRSWRRRLGFEVHFRTSLRLPKSRFSLRHFRSDIHVWRMIWNGMIKMIKFEIGMIGQNLEGYGEWFLENDLAAL